MLASMSKLFNAIDGVLLELPISAFAQEIIVMIAFFASYWSWRFIKSKYAGTTTPAWKLRSSFESTSAAPAKTADDDGIGGSKPTRGAEHRARVAPPAVKAAQFEMLLQLEQREFTRALNTYRCHERDGRDQYFTEELYSAFVQSAIRVGKVDVVERMLRSMRRNHFSPSLQFWQTAFKMLSSRRQFSFCLSVHGIFGKLIPPDKISYSCLINAALEVGAPDKALSFIDRYAQSGLDAKDYVLCFRTYAALGDADSAESCFRKLRGETTTLMLNLLLLTCVHVGDTARAQRLLAEAHGFVHDKQRAADPIVDTVSYNTVIKGYAKQGDYAKCLICLKDMLTRGIEPDDVTFGTLLDACIGTNQMGATDEIVALFLARDKPMDTVMHTLFMKGLVRAKCVPKALELYEEMKRREGSHPDIVTYSVLIKALVDNKDMDRALELMQDMIQAGLTPDDIILTHLLEGCRLLGNHELGKKLFDDMLALGVKPSEFTLVTMLKLHGRVGAHDEAYGLVATWESRHGAKPSVIHYTCVMSGCLRSKQYDQAWAAYELMYSRGVLPDETSIATLLPGLIVAQQWERVVVVVRRALKAATPLSIPTETLNSALSQMRVAPGARAFADQLTKLMQDCSVPLTTRNCKQARIQGMQAF